MLIEVKAKVNRIIDSKTRKRTETFIVPDCELFVNAEHLVMTRLSQEQEEGSIESYELLSLRQSILKEVCTQYQGEHSYVATLKDIFLADDNTEKVIKYKVLLWANSLSEAMSRTTTLSHQGYSMGVDGLKEVDYEYLTGENNE